jgi:ATP-dependent Lhr-like helicase
LAELVAAGLVSSDSFGGLRALLVPSRERRSIAGRRRRAKAPGMDAAGRWALARRPGASKPETPALAKAAEQAAVEHVARVVLRRYGVVFWRLLEREAPGLPPWRDLLRVYRRLEARGEVRGGRFVAGFSGEQFALPEAIGELRKIRREPHSGSWISLSGADPLNLVGILTPGPRLAALTGNRLLYRDGLPMAALAAGEVQFLQAMDVATEWEAQKALLRAQPAPATIPEGASDLDAVAALPKTLRARSQAL